MRRRSFLIALLAVAVVEALTLGPAPARTRAQAGTPTVAGQGFVGAWRLTVSSPGRAPTPSLFTVMADGTVLNSNSPVSPAAGAAPVTFSSAGHGVWQRTGATTAALTFVALDADAQGHFVGTVTVRASVTLSADGNAFSGSFTVTVANPSGKVLFSGPGTVQGTRITVQPPGTPPAGTPPS